ncbi:hypothetical protein D3C80_1469560 [compost metagenome]
MSVSPEKNSEGLVTYSVYSEGSRINDSFEVVSIWISKEVNRIGRAVLIFEAGDMPRKEIPESDDDTFAPGNTIRVEVGYQSDEKVIFEGIVINVRIICCQAPCFGKTSCLNKKRTAPSSKKFWAITLHSAPPLTQQRLLIRNWFNTTVPTGISFVRARMLTV